MIRRAVDAPPPHTAHARLAARYPTTFLLESREGPQRLARYSILGFDPAGTVRLEGDRITVSGGLPGPSRDQAPLEYLRRVQAFYHVDDHDTPFVGGLVGLVGHDFVRTLEPCLEHGTAEPWPRFLFGLYLDGLVYDHHTGATDYVSRGADRGEAVAAALRAPTPPAPLRVGAAASPVDDDAFAQRVRQAQQLIRAGEAFQIVLSRPFTATYHGDLQPLYDWLRDAAAVPYLFHLRFSDEDRHVVGASPEGLVRVRRGRMQTFPIAGTRPATGNGATDRAAGDDLLADPKETAEHAMLVDLARNDLGRVAAPGSVEVTSYQQLQSFRSVMHLVSQVEADLAPGEDAWSALAAVFPAGTLSGAPKIRALEHIDALESAPRGPYGGAVCYASFNGDFDSAITIRSASAHAGAITVQAGAGIVHRSDPAAEAAETRHKAATLLEGMARFGDGPPGDPAPVGREPAAPPGDEGPRRGPTPRPGADRPAGGA